jgi:hypothetical protein
MYPPLWAALRDVPGYRLPRARRVGERPRVPVVAYIGNVTINLLSK